MKKDTYTYDEMVDLLVKERQRAVDIAYASYKENELEYESKKKAGYELAFIKREIGNECRMLGNHISGGNALGAVLGETLRDRIIMDLNKEG